MAIQKKKSREAIMMAFCSKIEIEKSHPKYGTNAYGRNCVVAKKAIIPEYSKPLPCTYGNVEAKCWTRIMLSEGHPTLVKYRRHK